MILTKPVDRIPKKIIEKKSRLEFRYDPAAKAFICEYPWIVWISSMDKFELPDDVEHIDGP